MPLQLQMLSLTELVIRVALACVIGFIIGFDREKKGKPVGYPAFMIITTVTCLIAIMGQELHAQYNDKEHIAIDVGKIIEGVLAGIGFLGAGAIIKRNGENVIGTATGASIWACGGLGLILGFGFYTLAIIGFIVIWVTLGWLEPLSKRISGQGNYDSEK